MFQALSLGIGFSYWRYGSTNATSHEAVQISSTEYFTTEQREHWLYCRHLVRQQQQLSVSALQLPLSTRIQLSTFPTLSSFASNGKIFTIN